MRSIVEPHEPLWARLREAVGAISEALPAHAGSADPTLAGGLAGMALFEAYLHRELPDAPGAERVEQWMSAAGDALADAAHLPSLLGGYAGIAFAVQHLREDLGVPDDEDPVSEVDEALLATVSQAPWRGEYDLVSGLVGFGVHACERLAWPLGRPLLEQVVLRLEELAVERSGGLTWHTAAELLPAWQRALYPEGYYNLGVAHGVPGVLALLAHACERGVSPERSRPLLEGALRWLRAQRRPDDGGPFFERVMPPLDAPTSNPGRVAWCYGDLGLSLALLQAARAAGNDAWSREALAAAHRAARRPIPGSGVRDAGLCHGAAGNAHLFHRLYRATGDEAFREASRTWLSHVLELRRPGEGVGGFLSWIAEGGGGEGGWRSDPGFLTGSAGIGLALLAATGTVEPAWDRVLLASAQGQAPARAA